MGRRRPNSSAKPPAIEGEEVVKHYRVTICERVYDVEIEDVHASPVQVTVNGESYVVKLEEQRSELPADGVASVRPAAVSMPPVPSPAAPVASNERKLIAPMPGAILSVRVNAGDRVVRGQELCVLEAMKMKNSIKSPRDGVIATVAIHGGQTVAHGTLLFEFE